MLLAAALMVTCLGIAASAAPSGAAPTQTSGSNISVTFTPTSGGSGICVPAAFGLTRSVQSDATSFRLKVVVRNRLCNRVNAVAAIYGMPGNGVAWPQTLLETKGFTLRDPGVTEIVFTKTCDPVQFDVITGATPPRISPTGPWHGPLLFPFDTSTTLQHWGCGPNPTTTTSTTTSTSTTTTIADDCDDYTPTGLAVSPSSTVPGGSVTVTGSGKPGTVIQVVLRPSGSGNGAVGALSDPVLVAPDGSWSATVFVPTDAEPGPWVLAARAEECDTESTIGFDVIGPSSTPPEPPVTEQPVVAGEAIVAELPDDAVVLAAQESRDAADAAAQDSATQVSGLAFTGAGARLPLMIAITLVAMGGLLLLRSRRSS